MDSGVYGILNTVNGHWYVGSARSIRVRKGNHLRALRRGTHGNLHLQAAFKKYGEGAFRFKLLAQCPPEDLLGFEQWYMDQIKPEYNISPTAERGLVVSAATRAKMSRSAIARGRTLPAGYHHSEETRAKVSAAQVGRKWSPETRAKMVGRTPWNKGIPNTPEARAKMSKSHKGQVPWNRGIPNTPETRAKISEKAKSRVPPSAETRAKLSRRATEQWARRKNKGE